MKQVLLADDEDMVIHLVARYLQYLKYQVIECSNGSQALNCIKTFPDDILLAIIDLNLPDIPGIPLSEKIKEHAPHIPVIIATGEAIDIDEINRNSPVKLIDSILLKPFSLAQFQSCIESVVGKNE